MPSSPQAPTPLRSICNVFATTSHVALHSLCPRYVIVITVDLSPPMLSTPPSITLFLSICNALEKPSPTSLLSIRHVLVIAVVITGDLSSPMLFIPPLPTLLLSILDAIVIAITIHIAIQIWCFRHHQRLSFCSLILSVLGTAVALPSPMLLSPLSPTSLSVLSTLPSPTS